MRADTKIQPGLQLGEWTVIEKVYIAKRPTRWLCRCSCGYKKTVLASDLRNGQSKRCASCANNRKRGSRIDLSSSDYRKMRQVWHGMIGRCERPTERSYERYGGRGIKVSSEFKGSDGFAFFVQHLGLPPSPDHMIDRIDNDGDYEPGNVRWATLFEQARNKSTTKFLTLNGETRCVEDWDIHTGLRIGDRLRNGWPLEHLLAPKGTRRRDLRP